jgi:hypothetical protein
MPTPTEHWLVTIMDLPRCPTGRPELIDWHTITIETHPIDRLNHLREVEPERAHILLCALPISKQQAQRTRPCG